MQSLTAQRTTLNISPRSRLSAPMLLGHAAERPGLSDSFHRLRDERQHRDEAASFRVGVAATDWQLAQAHMLVSRQYRQAGYLDNTPPQSLAAHSLVALALRNTLSGSAPLALGTVTLRFDSPHGLLADEQYKPALDAMRERGGRLAEFGRLAIDATTPFVTLLGQLVRSLSDIARDERHVTDIVALCHPRHAHFYCRALGFTRHGDLSFCQHVGAPALLLHLSVDRLQALLDNPRNTTRIYKLRKTIAASVYCPEEVAPVAYAYGA